MRHLLKFTFAIFALTTTVASVVANELSDSPTDLLKRFCLDCHGEDLQEAGIRLDTLVQSVKPSDGNTLENALQVLADNKMPPEDAEQPSDQERLRLQQWIRHQLPSLRQAVRRARPTSNRRLTVEEYNYTMQELFGVDARFDDQLPDDAISPTGYRNAGQLLGLTSVQVEAYLASARRAVDRYVQFGTSKVDRLRYHIEMEKLFYSTAKRYETLKRAPQPLDHHSSGPISAADAPSYTDPLGPKLPGAYSLEEAFRPAIPKLNEHYVAIPQRLEVGEFIVRVRAAGTADRNGRFPRMRVQAGISLGDGCSVDKRILGEADVTASLANPKVYEFRARLEDIPTKSTHRDPKPFDRLSVFDMDQIFVSNISPDKHAIFALGRGSYKSPSAGTAATASAIKKMLEAKVNFLHIDSIDIQMVPGPNDSNSNYRWTLPSLETFAAGTDSERVSIAENVLSRFMTAAFRRPITPAELQAKMQLLRTLRAQDLSFDKSLRETMAAVLVSPSFLFLQFGTASESTEPYQLASYLSYLLWLSPPDESLLSCAADGTLLQPEVLRSEAARLLKHPRSRRFLESFCRQWLRLDKHDTVTVDRQVYASYDNDLAADSLRETHEFFVEVFASNSSALDLITSDYAMLNDRVAQHYGISGVKTGEFQRIELAADAVRGGLLTQASVLTMNSDGVDSHPIRRGVWLLDRFLNDPPPPPPPQVPELNETAPNERGLSLKQRIERHRQQSSCLNCHQGIDPWGIPFENFDATGQWRNEVKQVDVKQTRAIDSSARLPDGTHITGIIELKQHLRQQHADQFVNALVHHMLTYALGREPDFADKFELTQIRNRFVASGYQLKELVLEIVGSPLFRQRTASINKNEKSASN